MNEYKEQPMFTPDDSGEGHLIEQEPEGEESILSEAERGEIREKIIEELAKVKNENLSHTSDDFGEKNPAFVADRDISLLSDLDLVMWKKSEEWWKWLENNETTLPKQKIIDYVNQVREEWSNYQVDNNKSVRLKAYLLDKLAYLFEWELIHRKD